MSDLAEDHQSLLKFLYQAPFALVQTRVDGQVEMMSPVAAALLLPLARHGRLDNLFDVLAVLLPDLRSRCEAFADPSGTVCEALRVELPVDEVARPQQILSISVYKLNRQQLMVVLDDITARVQSEQRAEQDRQAAQRRLVTQRRRSEDAARAQQAAEQASRAKTEFLSWMSHELRTPLHAILGFSELLALDKEGSFSPTQRQHLGHIRTAGQHLLLLIDDLLDVSRIELGVLKIRRSGVRIDELVREATEEIGPLAVGHQVSVIVERSDEPAAVFVDPTRFTQVLLNLLTNAIKYNRAGGTVTVSCHRAGNDWHLDIADTGIGMTDAQLRALYRPFHRLGREDSDIHGVGIGLVVTQRLIEAMGGSLIVTSVPDVGSRFSVRLPAFVG